ncbi:MAG: zinc ABC transporter substrate-binding protein [Chloroflexi bacterium]|nr:zinc ABC transporter substrate-binding protein [Chloroflexota bacterium]
MIRRGTVLVLFMAAALVASAAACRTLPPAEGKLGVAVTILPQVEFVEAVGGARVTVSAMVPPGANPESYEPRPAQLAALAGAGMYAKLGSGIDFELAWMDRLAAANPQMLIIDGSKDIQLLAGQATEHGAVDPHVWSSPLSASIIVQNIHDGLVQIDPANAGEYARNRDAYQEELTELDAYARQSFSSLARRVFLVYHPAWGYVARDYGLTELAIEEGGKEPTAARLVQVVAQARQLGIEVVFVSPEFSTRSAEVVARDIGGRVEVLDPLARDYVDNMRQVINRLAGAMR